MYTVEETLRHILEGQQQLIQRMDKLENTVLSIEEGQQKLSSEVSTIKDEVSTIKSDVSFIKETTDRLENGSQEDIKAMLNIIDKKTDKLASKEDIGDISNHLEVLNKRLFHQEAELHGLKAVK